MAPRTQTTVQTANGVADQSPDVSYMTAVACLRMVRETSVVDLTEDDFNFLTRNKLWLVIDRARARQCVESCVYGALDFVGFQRFPAPVEFIAASIVHYVHPVNFMAACAACDGAEFSENIINGIERRISASELFAHVCRIYAGYTEHVASAQSSIAMTLRTQCN